MASFLNLRIKEEQFILFVRELSIMIDAGLSIISSLEILHEQQSHKEFANIIKDIKDSVKRGETFSYALGKFSKYFDDFFVNMVEAGEAGGILDVILRRLADYKERSFKLKKKIKSAMIYPAFLLATAIFVVSIILIFVIPVFRSIFSDMGRELPFMTNVVISASEFLKRNIHYILLLIVISYFLLLRLKRKDNIRFFIDQIALKLPVLGSFFSRLAVAKFARTTGVLIGSGVSILDSLTISSKTAGNRVIEKSLDKVRFAIIEGSGFSESLFKDSVFPSMVCQMVLVGETTGSLDTTLTKLADFYDEQVNVSLENMTAMFEPFIILFLGIVIGFLLVSMYLPIFKMAEGMI